MGGKTQKSGKSLHYSVISISKFEKNKILMDNKAIFEILNFFRLKMSLNDILSPIPPKLDLTLHSLPLPTSLLSLDVSKL